MTETTTIRIPVETKDRLTAYRDGDQSIGDIVTWLTTITPTNTEVTRTRASLHAYLRTHLVKDFGDRDELTDGERLWQELGELQYRGTPDSTATTAVILDHTALAMLGAGRRLPAQLIYALPGARLRRIFAPTQAIYTATVQRNGLARHLKELRVIETCDFNLDATLAVGESIPSNVTPAVAHVVHAARPSTAWPTGLPVLTVVPQMYEPYGLQLRPLPEDLP